MHSIFNLRPQAQRVPSALALVKSALQLEQRQVPQTFQKTHMPSAVIIKGNPKWINNNPLADRFYNQLADHLRQKNYSVTFDAGEPHTQPSNADLWIGHSRGVDRLRFAPKETKVLDLTPHEHYVSKIVMDQQQVLVRKHGVNSISELPEEFHLQPPPHHYFFTKEMKNSINSITDEKGKTNKGT